MLAMAPLSTRGGLPGGFTVCPRLLRNQRLEAPDIKGIYCDDLLLISSSASYMSISLAAAYAQGRMAGVNHSLALKNNPVAKPPSSPYSGADYLAGVEWDRGFGDGLAQGERRIAASQRTTKERRAS
jgi:hypothetical protein